MIGRRFLAFDIETAAILSDAQFQNWRGHRPLGITCIAAQASDAKAPTFWAAMSAAGESAARMPPQQVVEFVDYLQRMSAQGYTLLTWNGLGFD